MNHLSPREMAHIAQMAEIVAGCFSFIGAVVWVALIIGAFRRDKKRMRDGLCMRCGYDLRHSKERCPECGEPTFKK